MSAKHRQSLLVALLALMFGFLGAAAWSLSGLADNRTRAFLLDQPEILAEIAMALEDKRAANRLAGLDGEVFEAFPGAVIGNPEGSKVLVEFTDYNCPYCEASVADVVRLVEEDPKLKVVMREWPIFEGSEGAARMALAAAMQGKYEAFHKAMFKVGPSTPEAVEIAAREAGLDLDRARQDAASDAVGLELAKNLAFARALGFSGTPAWIAGDKTIGGMVGYDALKQALDEAGG